ncbi:MAG: hypothetical protein AAGI71_16785 [Bacteroidota bacterium]
MVDLQVTDLPELDIATYQSWIARLAFWGLPRLQGAAFVTTERLLLVK